MSHLSQLDVRAKIQVDAVLMRRPEDNPISFLGRTLAFLSGVFNDPEVQATAASFFGAIDNASDRTLAQMASGYELTGGTTSGD